MIPVLGVPVLNRPDLLSRMLASIDVPVDRLVIVDNGDCTGDLPERYWPAVTVPPSNLGVAASWNLIIQASPNAPWWLLVNADVEFGPGDLAWLAAHMAPAGPRVATLLEFGAFGINGEAVDAVGWFDENFHPIYAEDCDYEWRCRLAGVPIVRVPSGTRHLEGGSVTYRSDPALAARNAETYPENIAYYRRKWGGGPRGGETFTTPFDQGGDLRDWRLSLDRLALQAWT